MPKLLKLSITHSQSQSQSIVKVFTEITKLRLSVSVVFSSVAGYLLGAETIDYFVLFLLCLGGYCMVGASNVYNQIIERDLDILMDRTKNRPLPAGHMTVRSAFILAVVLTVLGIGIFGLLVGFFLMIIKRVAFLCFQMERGIKEQHYR